jgi:Calx-beta domain-containing protein
MVLGTRLRSSVPLAAILVGSLLLICAAPRSGAAAWSSVAANAQHTGLSATAAQSLEVIHWSTPVDLAPPAGTILIHYGSPLVTPANTVIIPVKTGASGGYRVDARSAKDGSVIWSAITDYILPPHGWIPSYSPALGANNRLYFAGAGGTVHYRDNVDASVPVASGRLAFFGLSNYQASPSSFSSTVFVNTPITVDSGGNIYFGFRTSGTPPLGLQSGIARIDATGAGSWVSAATAAGDINMTRVPHQAAPALSNDERTLYVVVAGATNAYLVGLDPVTLDLKDASPGVPMRVPLNDPRNGGTAPAVVLDDSSASPMVGPDGDVYYGILGNPFNGSRGWLLHFSGDLTQTKTPGAFGWDNTAAVVPASAVPSYGGASAYLIFSKYNNYAGLDGGDGVNKIAVLDPSDTQVEPHASSNGLLVMKEVLTMAGPTPDPEYVSQSPSAVREWCINAAAVDPITGSVMVNSEDGKLYRWDLTTNSLSHAITLSSGIGEAYTPTVIGPDGTVYAINQAILDAVGRRPAIAINDVSVAEGNSGTTPAVFTVGLSSASAETVTVGYATADGTATVAANDYLSASGTLTFAPGQTTKTVSVLVKGDTVNEADETFVVNLSQPVNATISRSQGQATILNNDGLLPALSINDVSIAEGNTGTRNAVFTVTLAPSSGQTIIVAYATADGTATVAGNDYQSASGTLTFAPGQTTKTITVVVKGDTLNEADETFFVNLSNPVNATVTKGQGVGAILNDDALPKLSIKDVSVTEGNIGTTAAVFTVTLTPASGRIVSVNYATADGTAKAAGNDYLPTTGTLTFAPGETSKAIAVTVIGDTVKEGNETFFVNLGAAVHATIQRSQGRGTIGNDDGR